MVRAFPYEQLLLRLVSALLMETNQEWMERIHLNMNEEIFVDPGLTVCIEQGRRTLCLRVRTIKPQNFTIWHPTPTPPQLSPTAKQII